MLAFIVISIGRVSILPSLLCIGAVGHFILGGYKRYKRGQLQNSSKSYSAQPKNCILNLSI